MGLSTSVALSVTGVAVSKSTFTVAEVATGALFTGVTVRVTVATAELACPSETVKVNASVPLKSVSGVKMRLGADPESTPCAGWLSSVQVNVATSLSTSLACKTMLAVWPSEVVTACELATGASFTGVTVRLTTPGAVASSRPSFTWNEKLSAPS